MVQFKKEDLIKQTLTAIKENKIFNISDIIAFLPCSKATFYNLQLEKVDDIKESLEEMKIKTKTGLKTKWFSSNCATREIALYKLAGTQDERDALSNKPVISINNVENDDNEWTDEEKLEAIEYVEAQRSKKKREENQES
jgi:hypothetical protein